MTRKVATAKLHSVFILTVRLVSEIYLARALISTKLSSALF